MTSGIFDGQPDWIDVTLALGLALVAAYVVAYIATRLVKALFAGLSGGRSEVSTALPSVRRPIRIVTAAAFFLTFAALALPALRLAGVQIAVGLDPQAVGAWILGSGLRIVLIGFAAYVLLRVISVVVQRFEYELGQAAGVDVLERAKRARTLAGLIRKAAVVMIIGISALMILRELSVDIMPVLTGAGIAGLAVGFGAQTLVKDLISGFFLILENQVRVGDVAVINGTAGAVEEVNLRTIVLRDVEGTVHVFPNGSITTLANRSRDFAYYVVDLGVDYAEDTDQVVEALREVGEDLMRDPALRPHILEPLEILGVDRFDNSQITMKARIKTVPLKQLDVGRELRRRIKKKFDERGIEIPYTQMTVHLDPKDLHAIGQMMRR
jgi:small conductance mechanosensitive channel